MTRLVLIICLFPLMACSAHQLARPKVRVIYKHECFASDITCTIRKDGQKQDCNFEAIKGCAVVEVPHGSH